MESEKGRGNGVWRTTFEPKMQKKKVGKISFGTLESVVMTRKTEKGKKVGNAVDKILIFQGLQILPEVYDECGGRRSFTLLLSCFISYNN